MTFETRNLATQTALYPIAKSSEDSSGVPHTLQMTDEQSPHTSGSLISVAQEGQYNLLLSPLRLDSSFVVTSCPSCESRRLILSEALKSTDAVRQTRLPI
jgi:hypothetical protein